MHDLESGSLEEICTKDRLAPFETPALLLGDDRILVQVVRNKVGQIYQHAARRHATRASSPAPAKGLPYGLSLSPDGRRVAFHLASPQGYQVWTSDVDGSNRVRVAADPGASLLRHQLVAGRPLDPVRRLPVRARPGPRLGRRVHRPRRRQRAPRADQRPGDVVRGHLRRSADARRRLELAGLDARRLRSSFRAACRGRKSPGNISRSAPDVDHFNRDFKPELARGGTEICRLDPRDGSVTALTHSDPPVWDFRASESPDGKHDRLLPRGDRQRAGDLGDGCRRQEPAPDHARPATTAAPITPAGCRRSIENAGKLLFSCAAKWYDQASALAGHIQSMRSWAPESNHVKQAARTLVAGESCGFLAAPAADRTGSLFPVARLRSLGMPPPAGGQSVGGRSQWSGKWHGQHVPMGKHRAGQHRQRRRDDHRLG